MKASIVLKTNVLQTARVIQMEGIFDVPPSRQSVKTWEVNLPIEDRPWNIGLIVGPSGSGKSTVARRLFKRQLLTSYPWQDRKSILDGFPESMSIADITEILSSVGFSSPPSWVRPFKFLSTGEQFRVTLARLLADGQTDRDTITDDQQSKISIIDEYTSTVDRTVAQIGSAAVAKTIRKRNLRFIAVTCHEDVEAWLQPDWVFRPDLNLFQWRELQQRPTIELDIRRVHYSAWKLFAPHHYLSAQHNKSAVCFCAFWNDAPVAFHSWLPFKGRLKDSRRARRAHRIVCLPDYQGVGIGQAIAQETASMWAALGYRVFSASSHPAEISSKRQSPFYKNGNQGRSSGDKRADFHRTRSISRSIASFEYIGPAMQFDDAFALLHSM